jgi:hypothetical protein
VPCKLLLAVSRIVDGDNTMRPAHVASDGDITVTTRQANEIQRKRVQKHIMSSEPFKHAQTLLCTS